MAAQADTSRGGSREHISVQPIAPTSRRASQQRLDRDRERESSALAAPHPYASPPNTGGFRSTAYGRQSPIPPNGVSSQANGNGATPNTNTSDSFLYGGAQAQVVKNAANSREGTANGGTVRVDQVPVSRGMNVYDREHMTRVGEQDEEGHGAPQKKSIWAAFCCRA